MINHYFQSGIPMGVRPESLLMEDLIIECLKIYGFETFYLPRKEVNLDTIFTEDPLNKFSSSYSIEAYLQNVTGFEGEGDLLSKFGLELRDKATFIVSRRRWQELVGRTGNAVIPNRPAEGDIIYFPLTNSYFDIQRVEMLDPFFQVGKLYVFKLQCELLQYSAERFGTGVDQIDSNPASKTFDTKEFDFLLEDGNSLLLEYETPSSLIIETFSIDTVDNHSQNEIFETDVFSILDFSEKNPFGEVL